MTATIDTGSVDTGTTTILDTVRGTRDAMTARRVFGDPYEVDDVTVIPVARVSGSAAGGGGEGTNDGETGQGFGTGFGVSAQPVGVYEVHDGALAWHPALDVTRIALRGLLLVGFLAACITSLARRPR
jgi:uncharacterized spore protein YtfJ